MHYYEFFGLNYVGELYAIEKIARERELFPDGIFALRKEKAEPILEEFKARMEKRLSQSPPHGLPGKALNYSLSHWAKLIRYLEEGHISPDNNAAENAIRPFVIGRKNWLFSGHPNGANAAATLYSLIETARSCRLEPSTNTCAVCLKDSHTLERKRTAWSCFANG